jgi:hypothetical protein
MIFVILREILGRTVPTAYLIITGIVFVLVIVFLPDGLTSSGAMIRNFLTSRTRKSGPSLSEEIETQDSVV